MSPWGRWDRALTTPLDDDDLRLIVSRWLTRDA